MFLSFLLRDVSETTLNLLRVSVVCNCKTIISNGARSTLMWMYENMGIISVQFTVQRRGLGEGKCNITNFDLPKILNVFESEIF